VGASAVAEGSVEAFSVSGEALGAAVAVASAGELGKGSAAATGAGAAEGGGSAEGCSSATPVLERKAKKAPAPPSARTASAPAATRGAALRRTRGGWVSPQEA
jgi:hypothetical protein